MIGRLMDNENNQYPQPCLFDTFIPNGMNMIFHVCDVVTGKVAVPPVEIILVVLVKVTFN